MKGVAAALPLSDLSSRAYELKAFEDALEAVVCAWVGAASYTGRQQLMAIPGRQYGFQVPDLECQVCTFIIGQAFENRLVALCRLDRQSEP